MSTSTYFKKLGPTSIFSYSNLFTHIVFDLKTLGTYSDIDDEQLDAVVRQAQTEQPGIGLRLLKGKLQSQGRRVQWDRLPLSLLRTDPVGVHERWRKAIHCRKYWVPGPLALWHIDGNHKLIRFVGTRYYPMSKTAYSM